MTATPAPPMTVYRPAPISGPTSRSASRLVDSVALASTRDSSGTICFSNPFNAAGKVTNDTP
jgi:hypothetical protein